MKMLFSDDDFWSIEKLLAKKPARPKKQAITTHEVSVDGDGGPSEGTWVKNLLDSIKSANNPNSAEDLIEWESDYKGVRDSTVVIKASAGKWNNLYQYHTNFRDEAIRFYKKGGSGQAEYHPFFSFMPQYRDLSERQVAWYLDFRDCLRENRFPSSDLSYLYLYLYETIHLADLIGEQNGLDRIVSVWEHYNETYPQLSRFLFDWVLDYCVIWNLPIPFQALDRIIPYTQLRTDPLLKNIYIFDYLLTGAEPIGGARLSYLVTNLSKYNYKKSRYYKENAGFRQAMDGAVSEILPGLLYNKGETDAEGIRYYRDRNGYLPTYKIASVKTIRPSYLGAICSPECKKNIIVEYFPYLTDEILLGQVTEIVKYIENKVRTSRQIKARLSVNMPGGELKRFLDGYFENRFGVSRKARERKREPEQENEPPRELNVDFSKVDEIDARSWQTTKRLVEWMEDGGDTAPEWEEDPVCEASFEDEGSGGVFAALAENFETLEKEVLSALIEKRVSEAERECVQNGTFLDQVIDRVNEKALMYLSDILIDAQTREVLDCYIILIKEGFDDQQKNRGK